MKKLLFILLLLSSAVMAQKPLRTLGTKGDRIWVPGEFQADSAIIFPKDTIQLKSTDRALSNKGGVWYDWDGSKWEVFSASGGAVYLALADTASMLSHYVKRQELQDTAAAIRADMGSGSVTNVTGTSPILSSGGATPDISLDTTIVHTSAYNDSVYAKVSDSTIEYLKSPIYKDGDTIKLKVDSMPRLNYDPSLRDTSTWTENTLVDKGYLTDRIEGIVSGATWGSITGTLSSQTDLQSALNAKLNISDTASMLSPYLRKIGLSGGSTNQVLKKNSATDYDYSWANESGGTNEVKQEYTGSTSVTVSDSTTWLIINPSSLAASITITMPASPTDKQVVQISFGGTITTGNVVTTLTISPNTGQGVIGYTSFSNIVVTDKITLRYDSSNSKWYE